MALAQLPDISEVVPLGEVDQPMVDEIVAVLKKHNALDRFGLVLLHQHFPVGDDEILVESTDVEGRLQTTQPVKKEEITNLPCTETSWRLDTRKPTMACVCIRYEDGHSHQSRG